MTWKSLKQTLKDKDPVCFVIGPHNPLWLMSTETFGIDQVLCPQLSAFSMIVMDLFRKASFLSTSLHVGMDWIQVSSFHPSHQQLGWAHAHHSLMSASVFQKKLSQFNSWDPIKVLMAISSSPLEDERYREVWICLIPFLLKKYELHVCKSYSTVCDKYSW